VLWLSRALLRQLATHQTEEKTDCYIFTSLFKARSQVQHHILSLKESTLRTALLLLASIVVVPLPSGAKTTEALKKRLANQLDRHSASNADYRLHLWLYVVGGICPYDGSRKKYIRQATMLCCEARISTFLEIQSYLSEILWPAQVFEADWAWPFWQDLLLNLSDSAREVSTGFCARTTSSDQGRSYSLLLTWAEEYVFGA